MIAKSRKAKVCPICGNGAPKILVSCKVVEKATTYNKFYISTSIKCQMCGFQKSGAKGIYIADKHAKPSELISVRKYAVAKTIEIWNENVESIKALKFNRIDYPCIFYNNRHCNLVKSDDDDWCAEGPCSKQMTVVELMRMVANSTVETGKWEFTGEGADRRCSLCHYVPLKGALLGNICPNCGGKMEVRYGD